MDTRRLPDSLILLPALVLLVGILITKGYELLSLRGVAIASALTACVLFILVGLVLAFQGKQHRSELQFVISRLRQLIPPSEFTWLYNDAEFARAESTCTGDSIWIVSPDLANVTGNVVIIDAIKKNIARGIVYTYIVPKTDTIEGVLPGLRQLFTSSSEQLKVIPLPRHQFRFLSVTHIAVFNPGMADGASSPDVYLELPVEDERSNKIRGYWIKVGRGAAKDLAGRFRKIVEANS